MTALSTLISSSLVGKLKYYQPFLLVGAVFATIGAGLIYTYDIGTGLGSIIGYQILYGVGTGLSVQIPVVVAGAITRPEDQAVTLSTVLCTFSTLGQLRLSRLFYFEKLTNATSNSY